MKLKTGFRRTVTILACFAAMMQFCHAKEGAATPAMAEIIGGAEIASLTDFAGDAGAFAKLVSPSLESLPFLAVIALTMNPEYGAVDLSGQVTMLMYATNGRPQWCTIAGICGEKIPREVKFMGATAYVKKIDDRLVLSYSKPLLNQITTLPPSNTGDSALFFRIAPARYMELCPQGYAEWREKYLDRALRRSMQNRHGEAADARLAAVIAAIELGVGQISNCTFKLGFNQNTLATTLELEPAKNSALAAFCAAQNHAGKELRQQPAMLKDKDIAISGVVALPTTLLRFMPGFFNELGDDGASINFVQSLLDAADGRFSYYAQMNDGHPQFYLKSWCYPERVQALRRAFSAYGIKPFATDTYLIQLSPHHGASLFCRILPDAIVLLSGKINSSEVPNMLVEGENTSALIATDNLSPITVLLRHRPEQPASQANIDFKSGKITINARLSPDFIAQFIPQDMAQIKIK